MPDYPSSIADVRAAIQAKLIAEDNSIVEKSIGLLKALIFKNGEKQNEFNGEIKPENFASHGALLAWFQAKYPNQYDSLIADHLAIISLSAIKAAYQRSLSSYCCSSAKGIRSISA